MWMWHWLAYSSNNSVFQQSIPISMQSKRRGKLFVMYSTTAVNVPNTHISKKIERFVIRASQRSNPSCSTFYLCDARLHCVRTNRRTSASIWISFWGEQTERKRCRFASIHLFNLQLALFFRMSMCRWWFGFWGELKCYN